MHMVPEFCIKVFEEWNVIISNICTVFARFQEWAQLFSFWLLLTTLGERQEGFWLYSLHGVRDWRPRGCRGCKSLTPNKSHGLGWRPTTDVWPPPWPPPLLLKCLLTEFPIRGTHIVSPSCLSDQKSLSSSAQRIRERALVPRPLGFNLSSLLISWVIWNQFWARAFWTVKWNAT